MTTPKIPLCGAVFEGSEDAVKPTCTLWQAHPRVADVSDPDGPRWDHTNHDANVYWNDYIPARDEDSVKSNHWTAEKLVHALGLSPADLEAGNLVSTEEALRARLTVAEAALDQIAHLFRISWFEDLVGAAGVKPEQFTATEAGRKVFIDATKERTMLVRGALATTGRRIEVFGKAE